MKYEITLNGKTYEVEVEECEAVITSSVPAAAPVQQTAPVAEAAPSQSVSAEGRSIPSPMPGTILSVNVSVGQAVKSGDVLMVLEAMKMENDISAPCDGTVKQLLVSKGSTVNTDDVLVVI